MKVKMGKCKGRDYGKGRGRGFRVHCKREKGYNRNIVIDRDTEKAFTTPEIVSTPKK